MNTCKVDILTCLNTHNLLTIVRVEIIEESFVINWIHAEHNLAVDVLEMRIDFTIPLENSTFSSASESRSRLAATLLLVGHKRRPFKQGLNLAIRIDLRERAFAVVDKQDLIEKHFRVREVQQMLAAEVMLTMQIIWFKDQLFVIPIETHASEEWFLAAKYIATFDAVLTQ